MSGSYFWHAHGDACDPVCVLDQFAEGTFIPQPQPRPILYEGDEERLAAALDGLWDAPDLLYEDGTANGWRMMARAIIERLREGS